MQHQTHQHHRPAPRVSLAQRRLRAVLLLAALAWVPTSAVLVLLDLLLWISIPFSLLTVIAVVVWLRTEASADRAQQALYDQHHGSQHVLSSDDTQVIRAEAVAQAAAAAQSAAARHPAPQTGAAPAAAQATAAHAAPAQAAHAAPAHAAHPAPHGGPSVGEARPAAYEEVFDVEAARSQPVPVAHAEPAEGTWAPVPVPPPTYAMKAKAEPRMTASGVPADVFDTPEFAEEAEELDARALFARRAVSE